MAGVRDEAMLSAVGLALTGRINNWWCIAARLRIKGYGENAVDWSDAQRAWLDRVCAEARRERREEQAGPPARLIEFPAVCRASRSLASA
jgi:hypothetical protein